MGSLYAVPFTSATLTNAAGAGDVLEIIAGAGRAIRLHEIFLQVTSTSDLGDANAEALRFTLNTVEGAFTSGSVGTSVTPVGLNRPIADTAEFTAEKLNTTDLTGGTKTEVLPLTLNVNGLLHYLPTPEMRITVAATDGFLLEIDAAPPDDVDVAGWAIVEEL